MSLAVPCSRLRQSILRSHIRLLCTSTAPSEAPSPPPPPASDPLCKPSHASIDPVVKRLARARRYPEVQSLLESRKSAVPSEASAREPYLASIIVSYGFAGMIDAASRTFDQMPELGCPDRTAVSLNALLTSYAHSPRHAARVPQLFAELPAKHRIQVDAVSYGILIKALCESGDPERAYKEVLKDMEQKGFAMTTVTYTPIIDALYKKGKPEEAERIWKEMVGRGCVPDLTAYNVKAKYRAHHGKPEELMEVIQEIESAGMEPDIVTSNFLITCYCKNGKFLDAKRLYKGLGEKKLEPNSMTYRVFVNFLCKNGDFLTALEVFRQGFKRNVALDFVPARLLIRGLLQDSRVQDAKWLLGTLKNKSYFPRLQEEYNKLEAQLQIGAEETGQAVVA